MSRSVKQALLHNRVFCSGEKITLSELLRSGDVSKMTVQLEMGGKEYVISEYFDPEDDEAISDMVDGVEHEIMRLRRL